MKFIYVLITMESIARCLNDLELKIVYDYSTRKQIGTKYTESGLQFALANENKMLGDNEEVLFKKVKAVFIDGKYFITTKF